MSDVPLSFRQWFFAFSALIVVTFLTWGEALNGYFIADDAWHVPLVYRAINGEPWLIWNQFFTPYSFHECLYRMYRPLTDVTFAIDCLFWKGNAWGYHLTNLLWHGLSACTVFLFSRALLYFVVIRKSKRSDYAPSVLWKIPLMVALLFVVYPGHAEPVCWPLPRIDLIGATFTFLSLTFCLAYFQARQKRWLIYATLCMIAGLMIKEMCAAIPLVGAVLYAVSSPPALEANQEAGRKRFGSFISNVFQGVKLLLPMFALLALYIVHRAIALGSLIGGYVGTIGAGLNDTFAQRLFSIEAYWRLFHPINVNVLGEDSMADLLLRGIYFLTAVLVFLNRRTLCAELRLHGSLRLLLLLLVMILPCLQIWGVTSGLIGARHAYTLSVPFLLALVVLIYPVTASESRLVTGLRGSATAVIWAAFLLFFVTSKIYARAWKDATNEINMMRSQIEEHVNCLNPNQKAIVIGLPTGIKGFCAFYTMDFLPGLLEPPLSKSDIRSRVICVDGTPTNDQVVNYSLLKTFLRDCDDALLVWQDSEKRFVNYRLPLPEYPAESRKLDVKRLGKFKRYARVDDGLTFFANETPGDDFESYMLSSAEPIDPLDFQLLKLELTCGNVKEENVSVNDEERLAWLSWSSQVNNKGTSALPVYFPVARDAKKLTYRVQLTQYKSYLFSGSSRSFRLDLPANGDFLLESAVLTQAHEFIPELSFNGKGKISTNGLTQTDSANMRFAYDVSKIPGARRAFFEVSQPYYEFHVQPHSFRQSSRSNNVSFSKEVENLSGEFCMPPHVVSNPAYYQIRVCAVGADGKVLGSFSDPVTVSNFVLP